MADTLSLKNESETQRLISEAVEKLVKAQKARKEKPSVQKWPHGIASWWSNKTLLPQHIFGLMTEYVERKRSTPGALRRRLETLISALSDLGPSGHDILANYLASHQGPRKPEKLSTLVWQLSDSCERAIRDPIFQGGRREVPDVKGQSPDDWLLMHLLWIFVEHFGIPTYSDDPDDPEATTAFEAFTRDILKAIPFLASDVKVPGLRTFRVRSFGRVFPVALREMGVVALNALARGPSDSELREILDLARRMPKIVAKRKPGRPRKNEQLG